MRVILALTIVLTTAAAASAAPPDQPPILATEVDVEANPKSQADIGSAIDAALANGWHDLHLLIECQGAEGLESVEVFTSGTATWAGNRQFELSKETLVGFLERIRESGFAELEETYGGPGSLPVQEQGVRIPCRFLLEIDGIAKQVAQRLKGEQSEVLKQLALEILNRCRQLGLAGKSVASVSAGLEGLARGELRPEALRLLAHQKPEARAADKTAEGWLLEIVGGRVTIRTFTPGAGYGVPIRRPLGDGELADILRPLLEANFESLPSNLYAEHYTDVAVAVLGHEKRIQARRFARMTPTTHGRHQERFDRILARLGALAAAAAP